MRASVLLMTHSRCVTRLLALLIGVVAGLRALTPPAVVAWGAMLGWLDVDGTWAQWVGHPITVTVLTILLVVELVTDQLPKTPSRTVPPQFIAAPAHRRVRRRGHRRAGRTTPSAAIGAGIIGAVLGTLGGYQARSRLVAANGGHDLPSP